MTRIVLVHGAATTASIWDEVVALMPHDDVSAPARPSCGDLGREADWLESLTRDAVVFGISGGATLVLALAARGSDASALIAHEPAAGSLAPDLFPPLAGALASGGVEAFGTALYGALWRRDSRLDDEAVARDLEMFKTFEPAAPAPDAPPTLITTGALSPDVRHRLAASLASELGYRTAIVEGASHFIARENPAAVAHLIRGVLEM